MEKMAKVLEEFAELLADKIAKKLCENAPAEEVPALKKVEKATKPVNEAPKGNVAEEIKAIRGKMATYLTGKTDKKTEEAKKKFNADVGKQLRAAFNQTTTDGLSVPKLGDYRLILVNAFVEHFGGDVWENIVQ